MGVAFAAAFIGAFAADFAVIFKFYNFQFSRDLTRFSASLLEIEVDVPQPSKKTKFIKI
jgi:hypothetical protein